MKHDSVEHEPRRTRATAALVLATALITLAGGGAPARAAFPPTPTQDILTRATSPTDLRARLDSLANALEATDPIVAGEARFYQGTSFARGGRTDSAIVAFGAAARLRGNREELLGLADARLRRGAPGDAAAVLRELEPSLAEMVSESAYSQALVHARMAWAHFLAGHADTAAVLFAGTDEQLGRRLEWRYRAAQAALATGDPRRAFDLLLPVAFASRKQDEAVMQSLAEAAGQIGESERLDARIIAELHQRDAREQRLFESWGGRRVVFPGTDGFKLVGIALPARAPSRAARTVGAVVLMAPGDSLPSYDSLIVALRDHGIATILVPPRGSSWAVAPSCPLPDAWEGREEMLQHQGALDARLALRALARATALDTTRYAVIGAFSTAAIAAEAARLDRRVRALILLSPSVAAVDRGTTCARLAAALVPAFFQSSPEDFNSSYDLTDVLYLAGNRPASRVVEARSEGRGPALFRGDPALAPRLLRWLDEALKTTPPARTTPSAARRKG
jgi:hypothetical protein